MNAMQCNGQITKSWSWAMTVTNKGFCSILINMKVRISQMKCVMVSWRWDERQARQHKRSGERERATYKPFALKWLIVARKWPGNQPALETGREDVEASNWHAAYCRGAGRGEETNRWGTEADGPTPPHIGRSVLQRAFLRLDSERGEGNNRL